MLRKIGLELDTAQRMIAEKKYTVDLVRGCLERAMGYLEFAKSADRLSQLAGGWHSQLAAVVNNSLPERDEQKIFQGINLVFHEVSEEANMPVREHHFRIRMTDSVHRDPSTFPCTAVLDNLRSAFNVGTIIRSADGFGVEKIVLTGITADPDNKKVQKTSMGSYSYIPWEKEESLFSLLDVYNKEKRTIYALETVEGSESIFDIELQFPMAVIFGNEEFGVLEDSLQKADKIVHIPMFGKKNSFNVGVSFGIFMYEARRQWEARNI